MKQFVFLCLLTFAGGVGGLIHPFWAVLLYYVFAVLRPQYLWDWALPWEVRWSLIASLIVLGTAAMRGMRILRRSQFSATAALLLVYGVLVMVSVLTAYDPARAQAWAVDFAKVLLIAMVAMFVIEHLWQVRAVAIMVVLALGYIAYEINFYYLIRGGRLDVYHYGYGGLDNNGAGLMLAMGLPLAYCFIVRGHKAVRIGAAAAAVLMLHAVMLSYSRGAMLAAVVGMLWLMWRHRPRWQVAVFAPLVLVVVFTLAGAEVRGEFLSMRNYREDRSALSRFESWSAAWQIAWEHPVLGAGVRNSNEYSQNYGADRWGRTIHNQYLQTAADSGIPAALAYLALMGSALWRLGTARNAALRRLSDLSDDQGASSEGRQLADAERLCLGVQASLLIFATGAVFLSLETFELPWLLLVVASVLPGAVRHRLEALGEPQEEPQPRPLTFAPPKPYLAEPIS